MVKVIFGSLGVLKRAVDFLVLGSTFYLSCLLLSIETELGLFFQTLIFATTMLLCVRLAKRALSSCRSTLSDISWQILGNAAGIAIGGCILILLEHLLLTNTEIGVVIVFSSIMAFFVLGTLLPIVKNKSPST